MEVRITMLIILVLIISLVYIVQLIFMILRGNDKNITPAQKESNSMIIERDNYIMYDFKLWLTEHNKREAECEQKMFDIFYNFCTENNIVIKIINKMPHEHRDAAGYIDIRYNHSDDGVILNSTIKIYILKKYSDKPYCLGHEIGHYIAFSKCKTISEVDIAFNPCTGEEDADLEAYTYLKEHMNPSDFEFMEKSINIYYTKAVTSKEEAS